LHQSREVAPAPGPQHQVLLIAHQTPAEQLDVELCNACAAAKTAVRNAGRRFRRAAGRPLEATPVEYLVRLTKKELIAGW
jgi:hypothetical protein